MACRKLFLALYVAIICLIFTPSGRSDNIQLGSTELSNAVNDFGYKLMVQMMNKSNNTNIIISPTAIFGLLAMAMLGSTGKLYDELADKLGFSQDVLLNRNHHELFGNLLKGLNNIGISETVFTDALFVDNSLKLRKRYQKYLTRVYNGEALSVDFKDSGKVKGIINDWVNKNTNGKIPELLKENLSTETKIALLSALYFAGTWAQPFVPEYTMKMPFTTPAGDVQTDLMLNAGYFKYAQSMELGFEAMAFPYIDNVTVLYAVKPTFPKKLSITELMNSINFAQINNIINKLDSKQSIIRFPKMDLNAESKLQESLKALGIRSMFTPGEANFALMVDTDFNNTSDLDVLESSNGVANGEESNLRHLLNRLPNPGLHVETVLHSVKIKIDEYGTEAAAAAAGIISRSVQEFYLNSPFYMFIKNEKTNLITFSAVIFDPTH